MAPFERNIVIRIALIGVLIFTTDSTNDCNNDFTTCQYNCSAEVVQKHCTSENEVHCPVNGKCCPGYFWTKNSCQVCRDVHFMPDVNNCCECLLCSECDGIKNNTEEVPCSFTNDTVCKIRDDPTPRAPSACPWIESTTAPTTQVPTTHGPTTDTEESTVKTPSDPQESKSDWTSLEKGFFGTVGLLFLALFAVGILVICVQKYRKAGQPANQPGGQPANQPANQPGGQPANQPAIQPVNQPGGQPGIQPGGQPANQPGGQPANQLVNQPGGQPGGQPANQLANQPVNQPGGQPANQPVNQPGGQPTNQPANQAGGGGQIRGQVEEDHSDKNGDETDERSPCLPQGEENQRDQTTSVTVD